MNKFRFANLVEMIFVKGPGDEGGIEKSTNEISHVDNLCYVIFGQTLLDVRLM